MNAWMRIGLVLITTIIAGCQSEIAPAPERAIASVAPVAAHHGNTRELGRSVRGVPITIESFGDNPTYHPTVLILGGIHGDETNSVELTTRLIELLRRDPSQIAGYRVAIIRVANPDGFAMKRRVNANGVNLNRNFPASNYRQNRRYGTTPASQPETRAIIGALEQLQPRLIISIHCMDDQPPCNNFDGPAREVAELMSRFNHYRVTPTIGYPTPGSMGTFAGIDRKIPMITLEVPGHASAQNAWETNRDALLAAIKSAR